MEQGLTQVFTGKGKGKTTAALGTALRALGQGYRVCVVSFMKGDYPYGEYAALGSLPGMAVRKFGRLDFVDPRNVADIDREQGRLALEAAREAISSAEYDIVILDEINVAAGWGLIDLEDVLALVEQKPENIELILTGRYADPRLIDCADLVTEMVEVKHPYRGGIEARRGIEY